jgi:hypothetical protein
VSEKSACLCLCIDGIDRSIDRSIAIDQFGLDLPSLHPNHPVHTNTNTTTHIHISPA